MAADFVEDLMRCPDAEVVAVGSRTEKSARIFGERFGIPRTHGSWRELAADEVDIVYIATPAATHYDASSLCLAAGRPVLCEKPFTLNAAESRALMETAETGGLFLMEGMWMLCNPAVRKIAELASTGAIGRVLTVQADLSISGDFAPTHRLRDPRLGGGAMLDMGTYTIAFAQLLLGPPASVSSWSQRTEEGVDAHTGLILGYDNAAMALLSCSFLVETPASAVVYGTRGRIEIPVDFTRPPSFTVHRDGREPETFLTPWVGHGFTYEADEAMRCLREGRLQSEAVPWQTTLGVMETMDTARAQWGMRYPTEL
jgi:predicted dehydrogenase